MAFEGKLVKSRRKAVFANEQKTTYTPKRLQFAHQMAMGDTDIDLTALIQPISMVGFTSSSTPDLLSGHIYTYKQNLTLARSDGSQLIPYLEYIIVSDKLIRLLSPAQAGTVVYGTIEAPSSGTVSVDGFNIIATGQLGVGQIDVVVGTPFQLFKNPSSQIGAVLVFRNGRLMLRNDGNITADPSVTTGNYQEFPTGVGLTNVIRFDRPGVLLGDGSQETYTIVSNGIVALQPTDGILAILDSLGGQMDQVIAVLAAVSGQPESFFQANPNQVDLRTFGNRVIALEDLDEQRARFTPGANSFGSINTGAWNWTSVAFSVGSDVTPVLDTALGAYFLINKTGIYAISLSVRTSTAGGKWIMKNITAPANTAPTATDPNLLAYEFSDATTWDIPVFATVRLQAGDKIFSGHDSSGINNGTHFYEINKVR